MDSDEHQKWVNAWVYLRYGRRPKAGNDEAIAWMELVHYGSETLKLGGQVGLSEYLFPIPGNGIKVG